MSEDRNLQILNKIYIDVLGREVDKSGVQSYLKYIPHKTSAVKQFLQNSTEYRLARPKLQNVNQAKVNDEKFNSMTGDRKTYISAKSTRLIDASPYSHVFDTTLQELIKSAKSNISIENIKLSIIDTIQKQRKISIFPHKEYLFNTENFIDSLKKYDNFQYYVCFVVLCLLVKGITKKIVHTCGSQPKLDNLRKNQPNSFSDIFLLLSTDILNQLSVRINGNTLDSTEIENLSTQIINRQNSEYVIEYLRSKIKNVLSQENSVIKETLSGLSRRPKVLLHIAYLENQEPYLLQKMLDHAYNLQEYNPYLDIDYYFENDRVAKVSTDYTPWSRVKRIRNLMLDRTDTSKYDYLYVIDSDIVSYPYNFPSRAIGLNPKGITAPVMLIENSNTFYDWCGYQQKGRTSINSKYKKHILEKGCNIRNFNLNPPYVQDDNRLVEIDCVGCTYIVPTYIFNGGYGDLQKELLEVFRLAKVKDHKILDNIVQYEDHPSFTDHYTICTALRSQGGKVYMDRGSVAYHADLPIYGENWH